MKVRTTASSAGRTMAATFILLFHCDKWRWNQSTSYTLRAAVAFYQEHNPGLLRTRKVESDNLVGGLMVYTFPDGSRAGCIKKDKTVWEIAADGAKVVA